MMPALDMIRPSIPAQRSRHMTSTTPDEVLAFWFDTLTPKDWFRKSAKLDARIHKEFGPTHAAASRGELPGWRAQPSGRLAEIIVLDQFSRNIRDRKSTRLNSSHVS